MRTHKNLIDRGEVKETFFLFCWMQSTWQLTWPAEEDISIFILKNICFLVDHWKDESASGKLHKGNDIYISNVFCKLITRLYICLVTSLPLWGRTTSFLRHLTFFGQLINPCRKIWAVCHLRVAMKLGQCWVELHYGIVLGDAIASFIDCWKLAQKLGQNASQNSPTMQFHATRTQAPSIRIRLCLKRGIFSPPFAKKIRVHK